MGREGGRNHDRGAAPPPPPPPHTHTHTSESVPGREEREGRGERREEWRERERGWLIMEGGRRGDWRERGREGGREMREVWGLHRVPHLLTLCPRPISPRTCPCCLS